MKIGLLSDTHGYLDPQVASYFAEVNEIWHAGDVGNASLIDELAKIKPLRGVYGNIDGNDVRSTFPEFSHFILEGVSVLMIHIGGYPGRYSPRAKQLIETLKPKVFICGHSHILKVMNDAKHQVLCMNPGAAGKHGFHVLRTCLRFDLEAGKVKNMEAIHLGKRAEIKLES